MLGCIDGQVVLTNGSSNTGPVSVCVNNSYVSVCHDFWDIIDAGVICRQLGHNFSGAVEIIIII